MITGLAPGTVYHARIVIQTAAGTRPGRRRRLHDARHAGPAGSSAGGAAAGTVGTITGGTKAHDDHQAEGQGQEAVRRPEGHGQEAQQGPHAPSTPRAARCRSSTSKSKKANNTVLTQSRKAGKKLGYRAVVKLTVATKAGSQEVVSRSILGTTEGPGRRVAAGPFACPA